MGKDPEKPDVPAPGGGVMLAPGLTVPEAVLRWQYSRSGGPGGQNVNKVSTRAELRLAVEDLPISGRALGRLRELAGRRIVGTETAVEESTGLVRERGGDLVIVSESERSQSGNRSECLRRVRELLVRAMAEPKVRRKTRPSRASRERRLESKSRRSEIKRSRGRVDG